MRNCLFSFIIVLVLICYLVTMSVAECKIVVSPLLKHWTSLVRITPPLRLEVDAIKNLNLN